MDAGDGSLIVQMNLIPLNIIFQNNYNDKFCYLYLYFTTTKFFLVSS